MHHKRIISVSLVILFALSLLCTTSATANAHKLTDIHTDAATGWTKWTDRHMGSRYTSYAFDESDLKNRFHENLEAGIDMWSISIHCVEKIDNPEGIITSSPDNIGASASVTSIFSATGHVTSWTLTIYDYHIPNNDELQIRTFAHEIGHVYGLGHVNNEAQIMYGSASLTKAITIQDIAGMRVMTHEHIHSDDTNYIYLSDTYYHMMRCNTCLAYEEENCYTSHWHSNGRHYFINDCICGNTGQVSIICNNAGCPFQ